MRPPMIIAERDLAGATPESLARALLRLCLLFIHPGAPNLISLRSAGTMPA